MDAVFFYEREIHCVSPEWKGGSKIIDVHIGIKGGAKLKVTSHASFEYLTLPTIQDINPKFGSINGGTSVTISGNVLS